MISRKITDDSELYEKIRAFAEANLSKKRYEHSLRVAQTSGQMCRLYGLNEMEGLVAGIAHDICKEIPCESMRALVLQDGSEITPIEEEKPSLLHGRAAAVKIQSDFGVCDKSVIEAVAVHTFGEAGCGDIAKVVFAADKIEPGRPQSTEEYRKNLFSKSLDELVISVLNENIEYLHKIGKEVAPASYEWYKQLKSIEEDR